MLVALEAHTSTEIWHSTQFINIEHGLDLTAARSKSAKATQFQIMFFRFWDKGGRVSTRTPIGDHGGIGLKKVLDFVLGFLDTVEKPPLVTYLPGADNIILQRLIFTTRQHGSSDFVMDFQVTWASLIFQLNCKFGEDKGFSARLFPKKPTAEDRSSIFVCPIHARL